jgi:SAM-dependent methyltransferase
MVDSRSDHTLTCPVCAGAVAHAFTTPSQTGDAIHTFGRCGSCGSLIDTDWLRRADRAVVDTAGYTIESVKFYAEYGGSPDTFASFLDMLQLCRATRLAPRNTTFLDVGTAFGFSVSMADFLGFTAVGVEPSLLGRYGRDMLGIDLRTTYLDAAGISPGSVTDALCSEVIEHVTDPLSLLQQVCRTLTPDGVVLLTTPNAEVIVDGSERETADLISAGAHLIIFTPASIKALAVKAGFADVRVFASGGDSGRRGLQIIAAKASDVLNKYLDQRWMTAFRIDASLVERYLTRLSTLPRHSDAPFSIADSAAYRLAEHHLAQGQSDKAWQLIDRLLNGYAGRTIDAPRIEALARMAFCDYVMAQPCYTSMLFFRAAEHLLGSGAQPGIAARYFEIARQLFEIEARIGVFMRLGWPERALAGRGAAERAIGDRRSARLTHQDLARRMSAVPDELREMPLAASAGDAMRRLQPGRALQQLRALRTWREARGLPGRWRDVLRIALRT